jgi:lysophospholipase L1-like esterase
MRLLSIFIFSVFFYHIIRDERQMMVVEKTSQVESDTIKPPMSILIIGDSQSAVTTNSGQKITWTWPNHLSKKLSPYGVTVDVGASGGKTSKWMLEKLESMFESGKKWDRVILYGGGNDASNMSIPLETTIKNFQKMIDISKLNGSDVWVNLGWKIEGKFMDINILPVGRPANLLNKKSDWLPYIEKRKQLQTRLKSDLTGCQFIEPYDLQSMTSDGIHPTARGHILVCDFILQTIDTTLYK